jgi:nitrogen regulatory protein P-II 1
MRRTTDMSDSGNGPELLVCIVKDHHQVEEILTGFLELGIKGATVVDARGMGQILSTDIPIFAGFKALFPGGTSGTYVILSVIEQNLIDEAILLANEICENLNKAGAGFLFTVPVARVMGLAEEIK